MISSAWTAALVPRSKPARWGFQPTGPSPADDIRRGSAKLSHLVEHVTPEDGLSPLPEAPDAMLQVDRRTVSPSPAPATHRTQRAAFPHNALLHTSREGLCDLSSRGVFRRIYEISNSVICEQSDSRVHPSPTPSLPAEKYILRLSSCRVMGDTPASLVDANKRRNHAGMVPADRRLIKFGARG